jgi:hypothetical protein
MRARLFTAASLSAAMLLSGCALDGARTDSEPRARIVSADVSAPPGNTIPPKSERKAVAAKSEIKRSAPTQSPGPAHTGQDEARCASVENCASVLKTMVMAADRSWMRRPVAPTVLANGVRLFAYRALTPTLNCEELGVALAEVSMATRAFSGPVAGLAEDQIERVRSLSAEVGSELRAERERRCPHSNEDIG